MAALVVAVLSLVPAPVQPVSAQTAAGPTEVPAAAREAIDGLWSPYCPGLMLEVCTSAGGAALRDSIQDQARAGMPADSILEFWVARYGEEYRASPTFAGAGRFAWITPFAALFAGLGVAVVVLSRRSQPRVPGTFPDPTPEDDSRIHEALAELDRAEAPDY